MREKKNVIVVMLDTLQFNYLGCYGNTRVKTPNIDRFATEGVVFENAYTEGLPTVPCRRAMLTGRYTLPVKGWSQLDVSDTTIADLCWGQPIDSYLIHDSGPFRLPKFGYSRGFDKVFFLHGHETDHQYYAQDELGGGLKAEDYYEDHVMEKADEILGENVMRPLMNQVECHLKERQYWKSDGDQHAAQIMKEAVRNLERVDRNKSFFMWIDCFDPHEPWDAPSVYDPDLKCPYDPDYEGKDMFLPIQGHVDGLYTDRELEHIRALYAEKVTMVDKWFGHLMNNIRTLGMEDDTLVILVSDHGSPMGKGEHGHGIMRKCRPWPYEELAHIPMITEDWSFIHWLKDDEKSVADARFGIYGKDLGESTAHILQMKKANAVEDRDTAFYNRAYEEHKKAATLDGEDQWTCTAAASSEVPARDELYCRKDDPFQLNNVSAKHPEVAKELFEQLKLFMAELRAS